MRVHCGVHTYINDPPLGLGASSSRKPSIDSRELEMNFESVSIQQNNAHSGQTVPLNIARSHTGASSDGAVKLPLCFAGSVLSWSDFAGKLRPNCNRLCDISMADEFPGFRCSFIYPRFLIGR